ncbi:MAG: chromosome condensation regulator RCC1 [Gemmatimonadales bacterium]|nr:chromosome condensation regulator RCC1 [Gemmatimonadales bacterium]MBA3554048.1 chromosome condensation regulator RCC1 [Gemmatimonadales bacterium]
MATASTQALSFRQVSAGTGGHTCGVTTGNIAYCWGANFSGELGDGSTTRRLRPVPVAGSLRFSQVSAGVYHSCGVTTDRRVYCWGDNVFGQLGDGTTMQRLTPVPVAGGRRFRTVDAGRGATCGVSYPDNRPFCWGANGKGQLGDGTTTARLTPRLVVGGHLFRQVHIGRIHTCGVTLNDQVLCWGSNEEDGRLGDGSPRGTVRPSPAPVAGDRRYRQVDVGENHVCAVTTGDRAFCWGNGQGGQIGDGNALNRFTPRAVVGGLNFTRVSVGTGASCGETAGNRAYCWGLNNYGQAGDGSSESTPRRPVAVAGGLTFSQVSASGTHTCGVTPAGSGYCWGANFNGEIGDGTTNERRTPVPVAGPS